MLTIADYANIAIMVPLALRIAYSFAYVLFLLPFHLVMRGRLARNSLSKLDRIMGGIRKGAIAHRFSVYCVLVTYFITAEVVLLRTQ